MEAEINNAIYNQLQDRWYEANDDPVALLRAESKLVAPWISETASKLLEQKNLYMLDMGCGGGFISNKLAKKGHTVKGIDLSPTSLDVAKKYDSTKSVEYSIGDVTQLNFTPNQFDVTLSCDVLEHVEEPQKLVQEAYRVTKPGGLFFFHTFDRNFISYLVVIKFVEWFVRNTPKHMHILKMFIKPKELKKWCTDCGFEDFNIIGMRPILRSLMDRSVFQRTVPKGLKFKFTNNTAITYAGYVRKPL